MSSRAVYIFCVLFIVADFAMCARLDNCRVGFGTFNFGLRKFENNLPRKDEVIRTKVYFKTESPYISISNREHEIVFGIFNRTGAYAIFTSQYDFSNKENPCDHNGNVFVFNNDAFVGVVFILEKTGRFSLIVDEQPEFALSCNTGFNFEIASNFDVLISNSGSKKSNFKVFYDCPVH